MEGSEREEHLIAFPPAPEPRNRTDGRKLDIASLPPSPQALFSVRLVHLQNGARVSGVVDKQLSCGRGEALDDGIAFRDDLSPALRARAARIAQIDGQDPVLGGFPVRLEEEPPARRGSHEPRGNVIDYRPDRSMFDKILDVNLGLIRRGAILHRDEERPPVAGDLGVDPLVRAIALAEKLDIPRRVGTESVVENSRAFVAVTGIEQAAVVVLDRDGKVQGPGETIRQRLAAGHLHQPDLGLILPAFPHAVSKERSVVRDLLDVDRDRMVRAHGMRIDQHLVLPSEPIPHDYHRQVLLRESLREEVLPFPLDRLADGIDLQQLRDPLAEPLAPGDRVEHRTGIPILRVDPRAGLGAVLVLEPAVRVDHLDAVENLPDVVGPGGRRGCGGSLPGSSIGSRQRRRNEQRQNG